MGTSGLRSLLGWLGVLVRVQTEDPVVALTFDDGPDPASTPAILDVLERYGSQAAFFVDGPAASPNPEVLRLLEVGRVRGRRPRLVGRERAAIAIDADRPPAVVGHRAVRSGCGRADTPLPVAIPARVALDAAGRDRARLTDRVLERSHRRLGARGCRPAVGRDVRCVPGRGDRAAAPSVPCGRSVGLRRLPLVGVLDSALRSCDRMRFVTVPELLEHGPAVHRFRRGLAPALPPMVAQQV